jgi:flagellar biosynthesis protein FlhG
MDQAAGLRRLFSRGGVRFVAVAGATGGVGKTSTVVNVARALALEGREVLLIDAHRGPGSIADQLGIDGALDLDAALHGGQPMRRSVAPGPDGVWLMPAAAGLARMARMDEGQRRRALAAVAEFAHPMDVVLFDVGASGSAEVVGTVADDVVVVLPAGAEGVTDGYALVKRLAFAAARTHFSVVVNRVATERSARAIFENVARVANRYLGVTLGYAGYVPPDERIARASKEGRSLLDACPSAPAAASYRSLAHGLWRGGPTSGSEAGSRGQGSRPVQPAAYSNGVPCTQ